MNTTIKILGFTAPQKLKDFVNLKTAKLSHFYDKIIRCEVCLSKNKSATKDGKVCEIKLIIPGNDLLANAQCKTFEEATLQCVDALQRQIEKKKTKTMTY